MVSHVDVVGAHIAHHFVDFFVGFAQADHDAGFGGHVRVARLGAFSSSSECW